MRISRFQMGIVVASAFWALPLFAHADTLGQSQNFFVNKSYDAQGATSISATLRSIGEHTYVYIDDRYWNTLSPSDQSRFQGGVDQIRASFDSAVYPRSTTFWGSEPTPGVDGDPHITILVESMTQGSGGYFENIHNYSQFPDSNKREMLFLSVSGINAGLGIPFAAHEFQHLISFNQRELILNDADDIWLNEARSEYNITVTGLNDPYEGSVLQRRAHAFLQSPSDSLVRWDNGSADYGIATLFMHYLASRYGDALLASTIHTKADGIGAINEWLLSVKRPERFGDVFADWMVASYLNDATAGTEYGRFGYRQSGLKNVRVTPQMSTQLAPSGVFEYPTTLVEWQPVWVRAVVPSYGVQSDTLQVGISSPNAQQVVGRVIANYADGHSVIRGVTGVLTLPIIEDGARLTSVAAMAAQGSNEPVVSRNVAILPLTVRFSIGVPLEESTPQLSSEIKDGDLIRNIGEQDIYVIWGKYRRYLPVSVLALYGFQDRPIITVSRDVFDRYTTSNYVRSINDEKVYAVWPDGTKHWLHITPAQWDASGRDWSAIFIVNDAEVSSYTTGPDITR